MGVSDEAFLPQIVGLFYATFDPVLGPTVLHQVPERLISTGSDDSGGGDRRSPSPSRSRSRGAPSIRRAATPTLPGQGALLDFSGISEYVIPKKSLHGKLVTFRTQGAWDEGPNSDSSDDDNDDAHTHEGGRKYEYRVMGLPSVIEGEAGKYQRNQYMWNLCFVFRADASTAAFEPIVRKTARILRSAELDSGYLSAPQPDHTSLLAVLEQIFEDLNSYSETSIPLDGFNWLELKLFPFYPNPPEVSDWDVPIALVDLNSLKDDNWDITAARVSEYINGINHSAKIAQLADADTALTRETLRHMLFYQVIMMIDIFQFSNMYTVTPSFPNLCTDANVISECGPYVTRKGSPVPDWPFLAALYTKLRPGVTIHQWSEMYNTMARGIDPRRFVSFGIIKGFLRRVHRWPVIVDRTAPLLLGPGLGPAGVGLLAGAAVGGLSGFSGSTAPPDPNRRRVGFQSSGTNTRAGDSAFSRNQGGESQFTLRSAGSATSIPLASSPPEGRRTPNSNIGRSPPTRRALSNAAARESTGTTGTQAMIGRSLTSAGETHPSISSRRTGTLRSGGGVSAFAHAAARQRDGRLYELEDELIGYLDGHHHADEIQVRLGMSWAQLEKVLGLDEMKHGIGKKGIGVVYR